MGGKGVGEYYLRWSLSGTDESNGEDGMLTLTWVDRR